jgi:tetratricopeptide (TPR) repeat protein
MSARVCLEEGFYEEAQSFVESALELFAGDKRMECYCRAILSAVLVNLGLDDERRETIEHVIATVYTLPNVNVGRRDPYANIVRSASLLGDHEQCLSLLSKFREFEPTLTELTKALYFAGESCVKAGDISAAMALFHESAETCPEAFYAKRSAKRMSELSQA